MAGAVTRYLRLYNSWQTLHAMTSSLTTAALSREEKWKWMHTLHEGCKRNDIQTTMQAFQHLAHNGCDPSQNSVSAVLHVCGERGDKSAFQLVDEYIRSKDSAWSDNEQLCNSLIQYKCKVEDYHGARDIFQDMQAKKLKIRHGSIWILLDEVVYRQDAGYAEELLKMCAEIGVPAPIGEHLLQLAITSGHSALATDLMATYANVRQRVEREVAYKFVDWLNRYVPFVLHIADVITCDTAAFLGATK